MHVLFIYIHVHYMCVCVLFVHLKLLHKSEMLNLFFPDISDVLLIFTLRISDVFFSISVMFESRGSASV